MPACGVVHVDVCVCVSTSSDVVVKAAQSMSNAAILKAVNEASFLRAQVRASLRLPLSVCVFINT